MDNNQYMDRGSPGHRHSCSNCENSADEGGYSLACGHLLCWNCLRTTIRGSSDVMIQCPVGRGACFGFLDEEEIPSLVDPEIYQGFLERVSRKRQKEEDEAEARQKEAAAKRFRPSDEVAIRLLSVPLTPDMNSGPNPTIQTPATSSNLTIMAPSAINFGSIIPPATIIDSELNNADSERFSGPDNVTAHPLTFTTPLDITIVAPSAMNSGSIIPDATIIDSELNTVASEAISGRDNMAAHPLPLTTLLDISEAETQVLDTNFEDAPVHVVEDEEIVGQDNMMPLEAGVPIPAGTKAFRSITIPVELEGDPDDDMSSGFGQLSTTTKFLIAAGYSHDEAVQYLETQSVLLTIKTIMCSICLDNEVKPGDGIIIKNCLHMFCRECLTNYIATSEEAEVECPFIDLEGQHKCHQALLPHEVRELCTLETYEKHYVELSLKAFEGSDAMSHCMTANCGYFCELDGEYCYQCPWCHEDNCYRCKAQHSGQTCDDYKTKIEEDTKKVEEAEGDERNRLIQQQNARLNEQTIDKKRRTGMYRPCPKCHVLVEKNQGCDHMHCPRCRHKYNWSSVSPKQFEATAAAASVLGPATGHSDYRVPAFIPPAAAAVMNPQAINRPHVVVNRRRTARARPVANRAWGVARANARNQAPAAARGVARARAGARRASTPRR